MLAMLLATIERYHLPGFYEPFSAMSHLLGAPLFLVLGIVLLLRGRGDRTAMLALAVYTFAGVFLMSMSGVYHMMVDGGAAHVVMERLDHAAIFILIAGTFTPTHAILFRGWRRWGPLIFVWVAAITSITLKTIFFDSIPEWIGLSLYLSLGWVGAISGIFVIQSYGWKFVRPLAWGAAAYTLGGLIHFLNWPRVVPHVIEGHEVFHVAVLLGAFFHWQFIAQFVGKKPVERPMVIRLPREVVQSGLVPVSG